MKGPMLPRDVAEAVESHLGTSITGQRQVGGGCIANATRVATASGAYFLKWSRDEVAQTFGPEAEGLRALREAATDLVIPEPILILEPTADRPGLLLMEWIESGTRTPSFWEEFGRQMATLHRHAADRYGFGSDNYIGRLPQQNEWAESWPEFFLFRRIDPQVRMAKDRGLWRTTWDRHLQTLRQQIERLLPAAPEASILHGDLWGGNFLVSDSGKAAIIDPATYHGHREADLAMTQLFGGFDAAFYAAYQESWPLESEFEQRFDIYNLYHLINHLNHFGRGYAGSVERILKGF